MITGMVSQFQNNWYFVDMPENAGTAFNQELLTKQKEIVALTKKHSLLAHVATNENADFYDYDVELNEESVVNFLTELETLGKKEESKEGKEEEMKACDLVKISCTCGNAHSEEHLIGVVVREDDNTQQVEVLVKGVHAWITRKGLEVVAVTTGQLGDEK